MTWVFIGFVFLNEVLLRFSELVGFWMYVVLMTLALLILPRKEFDDSSIMIVVLLVIPLVRISELFLDVSFFWRVVVGHGILLFLGIFYLFRFRIDMGSLGKNLLVLPFVVLVGVGLGIFGGLFPRERIIVLVLAIPLISFSEEIYFRGLVQNLIERTCGNFYSLVISAVLYGIMSMYFSVWLGVLFGVMSLISGIVYLATRNIFLSVILNIIFSLFVLVFSGII